MALLRAARAWALLEGRDQVLPEDVQAVLPAVARIASRARNATDRTPDSARTTRASARLPCQLRQHRAQRHASQGKLTAGLRAACGAGPAGGRATTACRSRCVTRRIYILPTRAGSAFAALMLVMLLAGLNYANSVAMLITFLLAGFGLIAMHLTHRNLDGRGMRAVAASTLSSASTAACWSRCENPPIPRASASTCEVAGARARDRGRAGRGHGARRCRRCRSSAAAALAVDRIKLSTRFRSACSAPGPTCTCDCVIAWPVPRGRREPPLETSSGGNAHRPCIARGDEEWAGLREFRDGDSPRQVAWGATRAAAACW